MAPQDNFAGNAGKDPYDVEGADFIQVATTHEMNSAVSSIISSVLEERGSSPGCHLPVFLVVQTPSSVKPVKQWAASRFPAGIETVPFSGLVRYLWDLFGDGRVLASSHHRKIAARVALKDALGKEPSDAAVNEATKMLDICVGASLEALAERAGESTRLGAKAGLSLLKGYASFLDGANLVDPGQAAAELAHLVQEAGLARPLVIVAEDPTENDFAQSRFYASLASTPAADIRIVRRDPKLFSLPDAAGQLGERCSFALAFGAHAQDALVCDIVSSLVGDGASADDIAVAVASDKDALPFLLDEFERRGLAFEGTFSVPILETPLGFFAYRIEQLRAEARRAADGQVRRTDAVERIAQAVFASPSAESLAAYIAESPFSPIPDEQRVQAASYLVGKATASAGDAAGKSGGPGGIGSAVSPETISFLDAVLSSAYEPLLRRITDERRGCVPADVSAEDDAVAATAVEFFSAAAACGESASLEDYSKLDISVERSYGDEGVPKTRIMSFEEVSYDKAAHTVFCGLDMVSMKSFSAPGPFAECYEALGRIPDSWQQERYHRLQLVDAFAHALRRDGSVFLVRPTHDRSAKELASSPLYNEVAAVFGKEGPDGFPEGASASQKRAVVEKDLFLTSGGTDLEDGGTVGDTLGSPYAFAPPTKAGSPHRFSPTELESYWCCPRKWFASRSGAGYSEVAEPSVFDPRTRGTLMHGALEGYYRAYGKDHPKAHVECDAAALRAFDGAFSAAVSEALGEGFEPAGLAEEYELDRLRGCAWKIIVKDEEFLEGFEPRYFEQWAQSDISGICVGGILDRIDIAPFAEDGTAQMVVVDYKNTLGADYQWKADDDSPPPHIQGLIYAMLAEAAYPQHEVEGIVYRSYADGSVSGSTAVPPYPSARKGNTWISPERLAYIRERFGETFDDMAARMLAGDCPIEPLGNLAAACRFCPLWASCAGYIEKD